MLNKILVNNGEMCLFLNFHSILDLQGNIFNYGPVSYFFGYLPSLIESKITFLIALLRKTQYVLMHGDVFLIRQTYPINQ